MGREVAWFPFDLLLDQFRSIVREEIQAALKRAGSSGAEPEKAYLTIPEAADLSRLSPSSIRLYIRQRKLRALKEGRRVIIKREDLEDFLNRIRYRW